MSEPTPVLPEAEVRKLRDRCFGQSISDYEWETVRHRWTRKDAIEWLTEHQEPI